MSAESTTVTTTEGLPFTITPALTFTNNSLSLRLPRTIHYLSLGLHVKPHSQTACHHARVSTCLANSILVNYNNSNRRNDSGRGSTIGGEQYSQNDKDTSTLIIGNSLCVHIFQARVAHRNLVLPRMPTNQIRAFMIAHQRLKIYRGCQPIKIENAT